MPYDDETKRAFDALEDAEVNLRVRSAFDRDQNLKIMAAKCSKIAEQYDADQVAVGVLIVKAVDLITYKVTFDLEEPVYSDEIRGERTIKSCWIATKDAADAVQACNAFYLQYLTVVDRETKQVIALHNV